MKKRSKSHLKSLKPLSFSILFLISTGATSAIFDSRKPIFNSTIGLLPAIDCYHALEQALRQSTYPTGFVAASRETPKDLKKGALLFSKDNILFFPDMDSVGEESDDYIELYGSAEELQEFIRTASPPPISLLTPETRGRLADKLRRKLLACQSEWKKPIKAIEPLTDSDRTQLAGVAQALNTLNHTVGTFENHPTPTIAQLVEYRDISLRRDAIEATNGVFHPTDHETKILELAGTPYAVPPSFEDASRTSDPIPVSGAAVSAGPPPAHRYTPIEALEICEKIIGEDRVAQLARQIRLELQSSTPSPPHPDPQTPRSSSGK